jgi:putative toxin-antitoxin system antitoxin component (TIGR02293 family)
MAEGSPRIARVMARAENVLGSPERATAWLNRPNRALGDAVPLDLLGTDLGAREVEAVLGRIEHGVYS